MFKPSYWLKKFILVGSISLGYYFLLRVEFLLWNQSQFSNLSAIEILKAFLWGVRFDLGAIALILAPLVLLSPLLTLSYRSLVFILIYLSLLQVPLWLINGADIEFVNFVGRRSTWDNLFLLLEAQGKWGALFRSYWHLGGLCLLQALLYPVILFKVLTRASQEKSLEQIFTSKSKMVLYEFGFYLTALIFIIIFSRGGFQKKPMNLGSAQIFNQAILNSMVLNSSFAVLKTAGATTLEVPQYFKSEIELLAILQGGGPSQPKLDSAPLFSPETNVVVLILESLALEYMGKVNGGGPYTPFLDELADKGLFFTNAFANSRRSIEGIPSILASVPSLMNEPFLTSSYVSNRVRGFGQVFADHGYYTAFFHGGMNGTMYFDSFASRAGFQDYFGANEYPNKADHDGTWGIFDEPFMQFAAEKLIQQQQLQPHRPFAVSLFSLSSHHPYALPEKYRGQFPSGELEILPTIAYADMAVRNFFKTLEKQPWYGNTLFIITADHAVKHFRENYKNELGDYRIPIIFFHPKIKWPQGINNRQVAQQIDILPTLEEAFSFKASTQNYLAHSLLSSRPHSGVTLFIEGKYLQVTDNFYLRWNVENQEATLLHHNQAPVTLQSPEYTKNLESLLLGVKASRQYFNEGMLQNRLFR